VLLQFLQKSVRFDTVHQFVSFIPEKQARNTLFLLIPANGIIIAQNEDD
jgi:hypothetical protein